MRGPALRALSLGAAAGLCIGLAGAPEEWWPAAWLGPGLLLLAIESADGAIVRPRHAILAGLACGLSCNAWTMRWSVGLFERFAGLPLPLALLLASLLFLGQAAPWAIGAGLAASIATRGRAWIVLPLAVTLAASGAPMIFPWRPGVSQVAFLPFVQCAELGGAPLVDLAFVFGACAAMQALRHRERRAVITAALVIGTTLAYGVVRLEQVRVTRSFAPRLRVGIVQHGLGIEERLDGMRTLADHQAMRRATAALEAEGADLVVWPESAYGFGWRRGRVDDPSGDDAFFRDGVHGPLLVGAITASWSEHWNSVLALEDGHVTGVADKVHLMLFGEHVPFWDLIPPLQQIVSRGLTEGNVDSDVLAVAGTHVGILNCYEDLVDEHARQLAERGAELLTNHTNDAWFGDTGAPYLHRFLSTMRAIETRRDLVRAVGTGPSGLTMATGERDDGTPTFVAATRLVDAHLITETTPWTRWGDVITPAVAAALLVLAARRRAIAAW